MLILHAPNVHQGGGKSLLLALLDELSSPARVHLDQRFAIKTPPAEGISVQRFAPSLQGRIAAEYRLSVVAKPSDTILCFGNLPPLFRTRARAMVFLQNRYLLDRNGLNSLTFSVRLRIEIERLWLRKAMRKAEVIVQTQTMAELVLRYLGQHARILPFRATGPATRARPDEDVSLDMLYVASGEPHKNHATLFEALGLLAEAGQTPVLGVTLDRATNPDLAKLADVVAGKGGCIQFLGPQPLSSMPALYARAGALVFPSYFESFGLPLLEAADAGLPIIASECDYVRDVVRPCETFDPHSARSIARAIQRFSKQDTDIVPIINARRFLSRLYDEI